MDRQRGAALALILAMIVLALVGAAAAYALSRLGSARQDTTTVGATLAAAMEALEQYAASARRLPCPANPAVDDGVEVTATPSTCTYPEGTLPWRTIGMRRDQAFDPWGRKLSYRVYTGNKGSLTQPEGISMVECDKVEPTAGNTTAAGLCVTNTNPQLRSTSEDRFLSGKGLSLTDNGAARAAAYVIFSHGITGLGAYTASGAQLPLPTGDERNNMRETGPFTIRAFSDAETAATAGTHFDDYVVYRTVADLVKRAGLNARDWPEADPTVTATLTFDAATLYAVTGAAPSPTTPLANSIDFSSAVVTGGTTDGSTPAPALSYDSSAAGGGIGVGGNYFSGGYAFLNNLLSNYGNEYIKIAMPTRGRKFAITLNDIGLTDYNVRFKVELRFYLGSATTPHYTVQKNRCINSGHLASFSVTAPSDFDRVDVVPLATAYYGSLSAFLISEIKACTAAAAACRTNLALAASPANATDCP